MLACELHVARRQIDTSDHSTCKGELADVDPLATPDIEHLQTGSLRICELLCHPWRILAPPRHQSADAFDLRPAWIRGPLLDRPLLPIDSHCDERSLTTLDLPCPCQECVESCATRCRLGDRSDKRS